MAREAKDYIKHVNVDWKGFEHYIMRFRDREDKKFHDDFLRLLLAPGVLIKEKKSGYEIVCPCRALCEKETTLENFGPLFFDFLPDEERKPLYFTDEENAKNYVAARYKRAAYFEKMFIKNNKKMNEEILFVQN